MSIAYVCDDCVTAVFSHRVPDGWSVAARYRDDARATRREFVGMTHHCGCVPASERATAPRAGAELRVIEQVRRRGRR